jgi:ribosomal-protein-alanine acetyltransferase
MVEIRYATLADLPQIRRLEEQASTAAHWTPAQYESLLAADAPSRVVLVAQNNTHEGRILGFLVARRLADEFELENVVVDDHHKKCGMGAALVRRLLSEAQAAGAVSVILEVRESNAPARRLYESIGFKPEGRRKSYYRNPVDDAILYRRSFQFCDKIS